MPNDRSFLECQLLRSAERIDDQSRIIIPDEVLEKETELGFTSSLSTVGKNNALQIAALNITDHPITVARKTEVARFSIMTAEQAYNLTAIDPQLIALGKQKSSENTIAEIGQLIQDFCRHAKNQPQREYDPEYKNPENEKPRFPTPET